MTRRVFSNSSEFEAFRWDNCHGRDHAAEGKHCWHDRDEKCPIITALYQDNDHPDIVGNFTAGYRCRRYLSHTDGQREQRQAAEQQAREANESAHYGGLFPA